jgi:hypothetical protein
MPVKTYTREVQTIFTREEMRTLLESAHRECKAKVAIVPHRIGVKRKRTVLMRKRSDYLDCIKDYIHSKLAERLGIPKEQVKALLGS